MTTATERRATCRYLRRDGNRCTGELVDAHGEIDLCLKHLGQALELINHRQQQLRGRRAL